MDPTGPIPFRAAAAYATTPRTPVTPANPATPHPAGAPIKAAVDRYEPSADRSRVDQLVAGTVASGINRGVDFDGDQPARTAAQPAANSLQFHTVSAARVEAATGVELGRTLDVQA